MTFMQRLIVLAALAAAGSASAQTAPSSSVTLFGTIDVGLARVSGDTLSRTGLSTSGANISRIGFRGTEDLGGGLAAGFWLEGGLDVNTGAGKSSVLNWYAVNYLPTVQAVSTSVPVIRFSTSVDSEAMLTIAFFSVPSSDCRRA